MMGEPTQPETRACVSLVIVSHSSLLAAGVREIAGQMTGDHICIAAVGGLLDDAGRPTLGTDAAAIAHAVRAAWNPAGVLLLVDLGSSVLSAELALDMLEAEQRVRCLISNAPLVEGAIVAAVEAGLGRTLAEVNSAAEAVCGMTKR